MPRRRFPSPEEYGRRLRDAKRRAEKQKHETSRQNADSFTLVLKRLEEQKQALEAVGSEIDTLPRKAATSGELVEAFEKLTERLTAIQAAIQDIDLEVPAPQWPEGIEESLTEIRQELSRPREAPAPPPKADPAVPLDPPQTIFAGPITLRVSDRDGNGDIQTVQVEPTRH